MMMLLGCCIKGKRLSLSLIFLLMLLYVLHNMCRISMNIMCGMAGNIWVGEEMARSDGEDDGV